MKREPFRTTWTIDDQDCEVLFRYYPGHPGGWYRRNGDPGDPPEPDELEIIGVYFPRKIGDNDASNLVDYWAEFLEEDDNFREHAGEIYSESLMPYEP